jgi:hypothetical protein
VASMKVPVWVISVMGYVVLDGAYSVKGFQRPLLV